MKVYKRKEFIDVLKSYNFRYVRESKQGSVYCNDIGKKATIPNGKEINPCIAARLVKELGLY